MVLGQSPTRRRLALAGFFLAQGSFFSAIVFCGRTSFFQNDFRENDHFSFLLSSEDPHLTSVEERVILRLGRILWCGTNVLLILRYPVGIVLARFIMKMSRVTV